MDPLGPRTKRDVSVQMKGGVPEVDVWMNPKESVLENLLIFTSLRDFI